MDAQQRLLLERSYEALSEASSSDAGLAAATAVVVGIGMVDYQPMAAHLGVNLYVATGWRLLFVNAEVVSGCWFSWSCQASQASWMSTWMLMQLCRRPVAPSSGFDSGSDRRTCMRRASVTWLSCSILLKL